MPSGSSNGGGRHLLLLIAILDVLSAKVGIGSGHDHQGEKRITTSSKVTTMLQQIT